MLDSSLGLEGGWPAHQIHAGETKDHERGAAQVRIHGSAGGMEVCVGQVGVACDSHCIILRNGSN